MSNDDAIRVFGGHIPSIYSNYFHVSVSPDVTKIVFGEAYPDQKATNYHSSITLRTIDARTLAEVILKLIAKNEEEQKSGSVESPEGA
jgi:hypothetical protein